MLHNLFRYDLQNDNHSPAIREAFEQIGQQVFTIGTGVFSDDTQQQIYCRVVCFVADVLQRNLPGMEGEGQSE